MITAVMVPLGLHHAEAVGPITVGPGFGEVPALGLNQLLRLPLPFSREVYDKVGFEEQFYILAKPLDTNSRNYRLDAQQFEYLPSGQPVLRILVDVTAVPANVQIWLESHHSTGR